MHIAIYSRKSVYTGKGESIENQIEMCRKYVLSQIQGAAEQDIVVYEDEGFSGKNMERPQFKKMMQDFRRVKPDYLVCYRLDRISRSVSDFAPLIEDLNNRGIAFICIKEKFDTSSPMGKAMMYIASVFAQLERETIAERVRDNMLLLARTGRWLGGTTPTGFLSEKVEEVILGGKTKTSCKLKHNPDEIKTVQLMFEKFLELRSLSGVSKYLIQTGIRSRTGKPYSLLGIKEILQNPVYCIADADALHYFQRQNADLCFDEAHCSEKLGLLSYNKRDYKKKSAPRQSIDKWIIAIGKHRGIVSGKEWVAIQDTLYANKPSNDEVRLHNDYALLSGLIYCPHCGGKLFAKPRSNNPDLFDYMCGSKMRGGRAFCPCQNVNGKQADALVCDWLTDYTRTDSGIYSLLENLKKELARQIPADPLKTVGEQIATRNSEMDHLIQSLGKTRLSPVLIQRVNSRVTELEEEITKLTEDLQERKEHQTKFQEQALQFEIMVSALSSLKDHYSMLTIQEKRFLIRLLVQKIEWDGRDFHVFV